MPRHTLKYFHFAAMVLIVLIGSYQISISQFCLVKYRLNLADAVSGQGVDGYTIIEKFVYHIDPLKADGERSEEQSRYFKSAK